MSAIRNIVDDAFADTPNDNAVIRPTRSRTGR